MRIAIENIDEARLKLAEVSKAHPHGVLQSTVENCHDCGVKPGEPHVDGCDVERCSVCGYQRLQCDHKGHDRVFARWTGFWPGSLESDALGINLNDFVAYGFHKIFFVKPTQK